MQAAREALMIFRIYDEKSALGKSAASHAANIIRQAIADRGSARIVAASAASQFEFLKALITEPGIDWKKVELFHLDEYIGLPANHPASFCKFLEERLIAKTGITNTHLLNGEKDPAAVIDEVNEAISAAPIDVAFVGIGENGHLAFNDPPADFETEVPYIVVKLDELCRQQQVGEGWFPDLAHVPTHAISMSIRQALKAKEILAIVPDTRKAAAIAACFNGPITPLAPSSILRTHAHATIYLDRNSAAQLTPEALAQFSERSEAKA
jgi:glucosamine-6-phosphate deaminase